MLLQRLRPLCMFWIGHGQETNQACCFKKVKASMNNFLNGLNTTLNLQHRATLIQKLTSEGPKTKSGLDQTFSHFSYYSFVIDPYQYLITKANINGLGPGWASLPVGQKSDPGTIYKILELFIDLTSPLP